MEFVNLNDEQLEQITLMAASQAGEKGIPRVTLEAILDWADRVITEEAILQNILKGWMSIGWKNDEPIYKLTEKGREYVDHMESRPKEEEPSDGNDR